MPRPLGGGVLGFYLIVNEMNVQEVGVIHLDGEGINSHLEWMRRWGEVEGEAKKRNIDANQEGSIVLNWEEKRVGIGRRKEGNRDDQNVGARRPRLL